MPEVPERSIYTVFFGATDAELRRVFPSIANTQAPSLVCEFGLNPFTKKPVSLPCWTAAPPKFDDAEVELTRLSHRCLEGMGFEEALSSELPSGEAPTDGMLAPGGWTRLFRFPRTWVNALASLEPPALSRVLDSLLNDEILNESIEEPEGKAAAVLHALAHLIRECRDGRDLWSITWEPTDETRFNPVILARMPEPPRDPRPWWVRWGLVRSDRTWPDSRAHEAWAAEVEQVLVARIQPPNEPDPAFRVAIAELLTRRQLMVPLHATPTEEVWGPAVGAGLVVRRATGPSGTSVTARWGTP